MDDLQKMEQEKSVLRWGGLAGMLGSVLFIVVFVVVIAFVGPNPAEPDGFPGIRTARTVEDTLYLMVLILWIAHFLALYLALRRTSLAPVLFGSVVSIVGLGVLAAGALPHVATARISELYHAPGTSPEDRAALALSWQATQGIFDSLLIVGLLLLPIGLIALGIAMPGSPAFGRGLGWVSVTLGVVGGVAACDLLVDPASSVAVVGIFAFMIFHLVVGWKVYGMSGKSTGRPEELGGTAGTPRATATRWN